jgi:hypothetical protein
MIRQTNPRALLPRLGLAASMALVASAGCGGKTPEVDTAVFQPADAPKPVAPAPPAAPDPDKEAPKG